jgi:general stress protein 26
MNNETNLHGKEAIDMVKKLVKEIHICLFCTSLQTDDGATARPMAAQEVDDEGNLWFFSDKHSDKNKEIEKDSAVQLFFSDPSKSAYLVLNGEAEIIMDYAIVEELWSPLVKTWFKEGKDDPNISIVKVTSRSAYYWDTEGNKMINFFKMIASIATGSRLVDAKEGALKL